MNIQKLLNEAIKKAYVEGALAGWDVGCFNVEVGREDVERWADTYLESLDG